MTNFEYASHINEAAGLDLSLDCEEIDLQDKLYGLFQCFMPEGAGVRAVFAPLQNGAELQARIMPIYAATAQQTQAGDLRSRRGAWVFLPAAGSEIW